MSEELQAVERTDDGTSRLAWFLAGAIVGATIAVLYAPKSGKDTRQAISGATQRGKDAVSDTGKELVDAGRDMFDRGRRLVEDAADLFDRGRKLVRG